MGTWLGSSNGVGMEIIKEALMQWGDAMLVIMENRGLFYSPVLHHWRVKKLVGVDKKNFLFDGTDFNAAFETLLGPHAPERYLKSKED
jgi:hypothetical protein